MKFTDICRWGGGYQFWMNSWAQLLGWGCLFLFVGTVNHSPMVHRLSSVSRRYLRTARNLYLHTYIFLFQKRKLFGKYRTVRYRQLSIVKVIGHKRFKEIVTKMAAHELSTYWHVLTPCDGYATRNQLTPQMH